MKNSEYVISSSGTQTLSRSRIMAEHKLQNLRNLPLEEVKE